jgi:tetratricopeptide (TPR) repeat protein
MKKVFSSAIDAKKDAAKDWIKRTSEDMALNKWLKKAQHFEELNDYRSALNAYMTFLDLKMQIMKSRPEYGLKDYLALVSYYIKIGDCYKNIRHYKKEERLVDFAKAAEYYRKAAKMYIDQKEYTSANVYFEFASKTYEEVEGFEKAGDVYTEIAEMYLSLENNLLAGVSYTKVGELYEKGSVYSQSYEAYTRAAELSSSVGDINAASQNYRKAAEILQKQGKYEDAIKNYVNAAELGAQLEKYSDVAKMYFGIARNYEVGGSLDDAARYFIKASETSVDNDDALAAAAFENAARCYQRMKKYPEAIGYYTKSADICLRLGNSAGAAENQWLIAECHTILGNHETAADAYFSSARSASADTKSREYVKGYVRSAEIYSKLADSKFDESKFNESAELYRKAGKSYDNMGNFELAGEIYNKLGLLERKHDVGDYFKTLVKAAERYREAAKAFKSAKCFFEIKDYQQAGKEFSSYADQETEKANFFLAAEGYRKAGDCYTELAQKDLMVDRYNRANQTYGKYLEKLKNFGVESDSFANAGDAYFGIGEASRLLGNLSNAQDYYKKALAYFEKSANSEKTVLSRAFSSMMAAKLAIQKGDYVNAGTMLSESIENLEESISNGKWDDTYMKSLEKNEEEGRKLLAEIGEKPEISLTMDRSSYSFVGTSLMLHMILLNHGNKQVRKINFLSHLPDGVDVSKPPSVIEVLSAKQSVISSIGLLPKKAGKFRIKPLEVLYEDEAGNKYVKSSNIVSLEIVERPTVDYRNYLDSIEVYHQYAESQLSAKNYFFAGEGYKSAAECFKESAMKRPADLSRMSEYYTKALDAYMKHVAELKEITDPSAEQIRQIADTGFNIADCYEQKGDMISAGKQLDDSLLAYKLAAERSKSEKEKLLIRSQLNVLSASMMRLDGRKAIDAGDYESARQLVEKSLSTLDEALSRGWDKDYENFLRGIEKETKDLLTSIKGRLFKNEKEVVAAKAFEDEEKKRYDELQHKGEDDIRRAEEEYQRKAEAEEEKKRKDAEERKKSEELSDQEMARLLIEKDGIQKKIEAVKRRYLQRQVDENVFKEILSEYEKQLIEIDVKIEMFKGSKEKTQ